MKIDLTKIALAASIVLNGLGYGGVIAPAAAPPPADAAFQTDMRAALTKIQDQQSDMRERLARVEAALAPNR